MRVLGIETSCDETGIALYDTEAGLLGHKLYSQVKMHAQYGGVVPELASRDHIQRCIPLIDELLTESNMLPKQIDAIAYTAGPGLIGALLVGSAIAKSLSLGWQVPALAVHHMEGHLLAPMLEENQPKFPFIALLVSGGHTMLVLVRAIGDYELLGETLDDSAGEAFDKTAKILGLGYPGGPALAKKATEGDIKRFKFPRPMTDRPGLDFSFSGLKTFALNTVHAEAHSNQDVADIACAFEQAVVDTLMIKCRRALRQTKSNQLVIAGGVSANLTLRDKLASMAAEEKAELYYPRIDFCTDNGAMIAFAGALRLQAGQKDTENALNCRARWPISELTAI